MKITIYHTLGFIIGLFILWLIYKMVTVNCIKYETVHELEDFVAIDHGSLNDCLTSCSQDSRCLAATYNPATNDCILSQVFGELGGVNSYTKKDNTNSDVFIDQDYNEYNVLESPNAKIIDWSLDMTRRIPYSFESDRQDFTIKKINENLKYDVGNDQNVDYANTEKYKYEDYDDFLSI